MDILLNQICDACSGDAKDLNIKSYMPEGVSFSSSFFACPMVAMDHLDCISGIDGSERMVARAKFIRSDFYSDNCYVLNKDKNQDSHTSFSEMAKSCKRFGSGEVCWQKLSAELLKAKER